MNAERSEKPATRTELFDYLSRLKIKTSTVDHPPVSTVAESSNIDRDLPGGHTKNLFLKDAKGKLFLIIAKDTTQINLKSLPAYIGSARLSFGNPELMSKTLGITPGSVTAFALINDRDQRVTVIFDKALTEEESINCHPLENTATTNIARDDLLQFIKTCGHEPTIVDFADQK